MDIDIEENNNNDNNNNNNNNIIDIYVAIFQDVKYNYNLLKIMLFDLLMFYSSVYNYYVQYKNFNLFIKQEYAILYDIAQNNKTVYLVEKKTNEKLNLPNNTFIVIGLKPLYKYKSIKSIMKEIINYDEKLFNYLIYLQKNIVTLINGMNKFNQFYRYCLKILFNFNFNNDDDTNSILMNNFKQFKHNYLLNVNKHLNEK